MPRNRSRVLAGIGRNGRVSSSCWHQKLACALFFMVLPSLSVASGFALFIQGASTLGEGAASVAQGSQPEVIFYNPALLSTLDGTRAEGGLTITVPHNGYRSDLTGTSDRTQQAAFFPATLFVTHRANEKWTFGLGVFTPFGLGTKWDDDWEGRYITTEAEMKTLNFNPVAAYQLSKTTSLAAGVDVLYVDAVLRRALNFSGFGFADGKQSFSGDAIGYGFNLGLHTRLSDELAFGLSYRSAIDVDFEGDVEFQLPSSTLASTFPDSSAEASITLPSQLHGAIAYSGFDRLVLQLGVRWEGWSSYDELRFVTAKPVFGSRIEVQPKNWDDTLALTLGGRYRLNDRTHLLAGLILGQDPIPSTTFEPSVTDSPHYALTVGTERRFGKHTLALAYAFQEWRERRKGNGVGETFSGGAVADARANGTYDSHSHFFAVSFTYVF